MKDTLSTKLAFLIGLFVLVSATSSASADIAASTAPTSVPSQIELTNSKNTEMPEILQRLSAQTNVVFVIDSSVVATVGPMDITKPSLPAMLKFLQTMEPGLTWQRIYLPVDKAIPDTDTLYAQVKALRTIQCTGLIVTDSVSRNTFTYKKERTPKMDTAGVPDGMKQIYYFNDDTMRLQLAKSDVIGQKTTIQAARPQEFSRSVDALIAQFNQLTPEQQAQMLPYLMSSSQNLLRNMDPITRQNVMIQMSRNRQQQTGQ